MNDRDRRIDHNKTCLLMRTSNERREMYLVGCRIQEGFRKLDEAHETVCWEASGAIDGLVICAKLEHCNRMRLTSCVEVSVSIR